MKLGFYSSFLRRRRYRSMKLSASTRGLTGHYPEADIASTAMEREPECYKLFRVFTTVMGKLATGLSLAGFVGILAYCVEPAARISPTICVLLLVSGLGLLMAAAAGGLFLNLVKNVYVATLQNQEVLRHLGEINPKEQARREARFVPRTLQVPSAMSLRSSLANRR